MRLSKVKSVITAKKFFTQNNKGEDVGLVDKLHGYGFYTDEQVIEKTKEIKALRSKGGYYLDDDQTTDIFLKKLQILYQDYLPVKGFHQLDILEVITGLYMTTREVVDE